MWARPEVEDNSIPHYSVRDIRRIPKAFKSFQIIANFDLMCRSCSSTEKAEHVGDIAFEMHFRLEKKPDDCKGDI